MKSTAIARKICMPAGSRGIKRRWMSPEAIDFIIKIVPEPSVSLRKPDPTARFRAREEAASAVSNHFHYLFDFLSIQRIDIRLKNISTIYRINANGAVEHLLTRLNICRSHLSVNMPIHSSSLLPRRLILGPALVGQSLAGIALSHAI